eukprot:gene17690-36266_t
MVLGWAWTYVIVAELIGASSGIGHMITDSQALLATDQIIFGIIVIGVIGLVTDLAFKALNRKLCGMRILEVKGVSKTFSGTGAAQSTLALQATDLSAQLTEEIRAEAMATDTH